MENQPLTEASPTEQPYLARRQNWTNQLARHALMQPNATALRFLGHTTTWGELDRRVTALAGSLSRRGVGFGDRVLILMLNRTEFIESFLAANKLGAIAGAGQLPHDPTGDRVPGGRLPGPRDDHRSRAGQRRDLSLWHRPDA